MKPIRIEVRLDCPADHAWETFSDPESMKEWVQGFVGMKHVSGEPETEGSVYELTFQEGKRQVVLTETVQVLKPAERFAFVAKTKGMRSECNTVFRTDGATTHIVSDNVFIPTNFLMRLMLPLMGGAIRKRCQADFDRLKALAEARYQA